MCRMTTLRVETAPGEADSILPALGAPERRLWVAAMRIDKAELQVQSVCVFCNYHKGPNIAGYDPVSGRLTKLFNPRRQRWSAHFEWDGPRIVAKTAIGRTTLYVLDMNHPDRTEVRRLLIEAGVFPP